MDNAEEDDDWASGIPIALPLPALKQQAHDLFDPITGCVNWVGGQDPWPGQDLVVWFVLV